jgi:glycosyltransferase involved in cell wall biosynthesis
VRILVFNWKDLAHPLAGGAEVFTEELCRALVVRGHSVTIFAAAVPRKPARETVRGVEIVRAGGRIGVYREARLFWARQARRGDYDIVIDEINTRPFLTPRWIRGTPIVTLIHQLAREIWSYETPFPVSVLGRYVLEPWWLRTYRRVPALTVSESSAKSLREYHGWTDLTVVPEGWTPHGRPDHPKEDDPTVVFLGRLVPMKRPEDAVRAFGLLRASFPKTRLWVIGDGPLLDSLRTHADRSVRFFGRIGGEEVRERLARSHVLVATSVREGWGLNVSEAATCGTPSIAYSVPGLVDSVAASGGALVDPSPQALGDALVRYFQGELPLEPRLSLRPWSDVAEAVEARLESVVATFETRR